VCKDWSTFLSGVEYLMHLAVTFFTIFCAWKWGEWNNWHRYHTTMIYSAMGNLLYNFLYYDHLLWQYKPNFLPSHIVADLLSTFIILPLTSLIFLTNYPDTVKGKLFRILKFIAIYYAFELLYHKYGVLIYNYGWNIWYSLAWLCMMFPLIVLHHKKPLKAYVASFIAVITMLVFFPANFK
jgi:hypothetical protein